MPVTTHAFVALGATKADGFNLLSNDIRVMTSLDLEAAVVGPQVNGVRNTGYTAFIDLNPHIQLADCSWCSEKKKVSIPSPRPQSQRY